MIKIKDLKQGDIVWFADGRPHELKYLQPITILNRRKQQITKYIFLEFGHETPEILDMHHFELLYYTKEEAIREILKDIESEKEILTKMLSNE